MTRLRFSTAGAALAAALALATPAGAGDATLNTANPQQGQLQGQGQGQVGTVSPSINNDGGDQHLDWQPFAFYSDAWAAIPPASGGNMALGSVPTESEQWKLAMIGYQWSGASARCARTDQWAAMIGAQNAMVFLRDVGFDVRHAWIAEQVEMTTRAALTACLGGGR